MPTKRSEKQTEIRMCVDVYPPAEELWRFAALAVAEDPSNVAVGLDQCQIAGEMLPLRIAFVTAKKWANGRRLGVSFLGGTAAQRAFVARVAAQWSEHCSITFDFAATADSAEIRITFQANQGAYSYIGTDALGIPRNRPTMNLGWLDEAVVLHEFGHALACIHEHQHPEAGIPWDRNAVYRYYGGPPNNWDRQTIDNNIFAKYGAAITQFSSYDRASIMHYAIDRALLTDPSFAVGWNAALSRSDRDFVGTVYPRAAPPPPPPITAKKTILVEIEGEVKTAKVVGIQ